MLAANNPRLFGRIKNEDVRISTISKALDFMDDYEKINNNSKAS